MPASYLVLPLFHACFPCQPARAQGVGVGADTTIVAMAGDTLLRLGREFILPRTFRLSAGQAVLVPGVDFTLDARRGAVSLLGPARAVVDRDSGAATGFRAVFEYLPFALRDTYQLRSPVAVADTATGRSDTIYRTAADFTPGDFFGPRLRRSGSLVRGIRVGSNRDVTLNSGFRLQMSGNISNDVEVAASLTDENSPIQAEGTTQTLQELDRVFIELRGPGAAATLGDLSLGFSEGRFGRLNRKLRGALGAWTPGEGPVRGGAEAGGASVRGKYASNDIRGVDGVQGPYRLTGKNNEFPVIVIAGTERVYIDGREMVRGLLNDYTIDYSLGEVTFTTRTRITFASRIVVEFEYADRRYSRNFLGGRARFSSEDGRWSVGGMALRENDDENALQDGDLSPSDRQLLAAAGDDPGLASRSGIVLAGPGKGRYELRDTTVFVPVPGGMVDTTVLVFNPSDTLRAVYNVVFSHVGPSGGDYERVSAGHYRYAGPGRGSYAPVRFLPFAERRAFANVALSGELPGEFGVDAEYAASSFDRNSFSTLDDGDNGDGAYDVALRYGTAGLSRGGSGAAGFGLKVRERRTGAHFAPPERYEEIEYDREWNTGGARGGRDLLRDAALTFSPAGGPGFDGYAGLLKRGTGFSSGRYSTGVRAGDGLRYSIELLRSDDAPSMRSTRRVRQEGNGRFDLGPFTPRLTWRSERRADRSDSSGGLLPASYEFRELTPGVSIDSVLGMSGSADFGYRRDDSVRAGDLTKAVESFFQTYRWSLDGAGWVHSSIDLLLQKRRYDRAFTPKRTENSALVRSLTRLSPADRVVQADLFYEVSPEQSSRLERLFQQVPRGTGNYRYAGDLNSNGVIDEPDFRPVRYDGDYVLLTLPTDSLVPVLNLRSSVRFRFDLSRLFTPGGWQGPGFLSPLSGETYVRVEEKSADTVRGNVYLLKLGTFRRPATTLQGTLLFLQELNLFESDPRFSMKVRFQQRRGFTRLSGGDEAVYSRERGARFRWSLGAELSNQVEFRHQTDAVAGTRESVRNRSVHSTSVDLEWTYRPAGDLESTFGFGFGHAKNYEIATASLNSQRVSVSYLVSEVGRLRTDFGREEAVVAGISTDLPYELTRGRIPGTTWIWGGTFEYRLTRFLESSMRYEGRKEGYLRAVHAGSLEVRAFF